MIFSSVIITLSMIHDRATVTAVIDTAQQTAETYYPPCAARLYANEPGFHGECVAFIPDVT